MSLDEKHKPYVISSSDHFTLVLPDLTCDEGVPDTTLPDVVFESAATHNENERKVLSFCFYGYRSTEEISSFLGMTNSTYFRKNILGELVDEELLLVQKRGHTVLYHTNREKVDSL